MQVERTKPTQGERRKVLTNSESVLGSIFNQFHTGANSVTAVQGSVQMGRVIFQERESGRNKTGRECRRGKKETGKERKKTKIEYKRKEVKEK